MIKIQGGDTAEKTGIKGGESIWGPTSFPDEFHPDNAHDKVSLVVVCYFDMHIIYYILLFSFVRNDPVRCFVKWYSHHTYLLTCIDNLYSIIMTSAWCSEHGK